MKRSLRLVLSVVALACASSSTASAQSDGCIVQFSDQFALSHIYNEARGQFAFWSMLDAQGSVVPCSDENGAPGCWFYREKCGNTSNYVNVEPIGTNVNHAHLPFADPGLQDPFCNCDPGDGYGIGNHPKENGVCPELPPSCVDWSAKARTGAYPHLYTDGLVVKVDNQGNPGQTFDLFDITVGGTQSIMITYQNSSGVYNTGAIAPGYHTLPFIVKIQWAQIRVFAYVNNGTAGDGSALKVIDLGIWTPGGTFSLAQGMPATQSSIAYGGVPSRAVDGNTDGNWGNGSVTHTNNEMAWWQVDLTYSQPIGKVNVWNRSDCCADRLTNFDVQYSSNGTSWIWGSQVVGQAGYPTTVSFAGFGGPARYVRIKPRTQNYLSIAEVEVFAY
jgi:hypothetical protein